MRPNRHRVPLRRLIPTMRHASALLTPCSINRTNRSLLLRRPTARSTTPPAADPVPPLAPLTLGVATFTGIGPITVGPNGFVIISGPAQHLVAAFDHGPRAVVGQVAVSAKSNEAPSVRGADCMFRPHRHHRRRRGHAPCHGSRSDVVGVHRVKGVKPLVRNWSAGSPQNDHQPSSAGNVPRR